VARVKAVAPISITSPAREKDPNLQLYVVFTDLEATKAALKAASHLARDLNARLVLLVAKVVSYPLPLEAPPVSNAFTAGVLSQLAAEQEVDVTARVYLCRDRDATIRHALGPGSLVVMGCWKRWWRNRTPLLARLLKRDGNEVILVDISCIQPACIDSVNVESIF
jgi:hypothetical protein